jgi:hypothetical protein
VFSEHFTHYLSYGATDQQTVRFLANLYDGLLVPGTVAAFQREGTGGFVLALSALPDAPTYAIDPRFPLFQQRLPRPKQSHIALAELLGVPALVRATDPRPADFPDQMLATIAESWANFNGGYQVVAGSKFDKYARRLGHPVQPANAQPPRYVLPPYLIAQAPADPWWTVSARLYDETAARLHDPARAVRVVATPDASSLGRLLSAVPDQRLAIWVSGLDELTASPQDLLAYARAIRASGDSGRSLFALYGGFFSVLLHSVGLGGSSHGIGYGENRSWIELPESGPPPARYYLPQLHRYVQPDEAARLYFADRRLAECHCDECNGDAPLGLDYHALMRHSVRCRALEVEEWQALSIEEIRGRLRGEIDEFRGILHTSTLPEVAIARAETRSRHMVSWSDVFAQL